MSEFIDSFSTQQLLPPWVSTGAQIWSFVISVPQKCIDDYLESHFNAPGPDLSPYRYSGIPGRSFGMLTVGNHAHFSGGAGQWFEWNLLSHHEVHWSFPVVRERISPDNLVIERKIVWVQPFGFDDNSSVLFAGREIWGTEFEMGKIVFDPGMGDGELHIDVAVQGFEHFAPTSRGTLVPVIHARLEEARELSPADQAGVETFLRVLDPHGIVAAAAPAADAAGPAMLPLPAMFELNTLKQFRDVFDMRFAAYRALIASTTSYSGWRNVRIYPGTSVELDFLWTDSLKEKFTQLFGLSEKDKTTAPRGHPGQVGAEPDRDGIHWTVASHPITVDFAFSFTADVRFEVTDTLHVYGQPGAV